MDEEKLGVDEGKLVVDEEKLVSMLGDGLDETGRRPERFARSHPGHIGITIETTIGIETNGTIQSADIIPMTINPLDGANLVKLSSTSTGSCRRTWCGRRVKGP